MKLKLKVGQIYKTSDVIFCVKKLLKNDVIEVVHKEYEDKPSLMCTYNFDIWGKSLLTTYPTFEEAINSEEFRNGEN